MQGQLPTGLDAELLPSSAAPGAAEGGTAPLPREWRQKLLHHCLVK